MTDKPVKLRFKCSVCGKLTAGRVPRLSWNKGILRPDGSITYQYNTDFRYPRKHYVNGRVCPGTWQEAEWVEKEDSE